jgi:hypothetical protein
VFSAVYAEGKKRIPDKLSIKALCSVKVMREYPYIFSKEKE